MVDGEFAQVSGPSTDGPGTGAGRPVAGSPVASSPEGSLADICALVGCDVPLPVRALDEHGRPKGGRRPQYCGKAHADAASRQRRARDVAAVADPLSLARTAGETFLPSARQLAAQLSELIARFDEAEAGALGRVREAEQEAAAAVAEAALARESAEAAEQDRRQALATARQDRQARDNAVKEAERARQEAEQIRTAAWEQVAVHERSRGQAEAARVGAQNAADGLIAQNRQLRAEIEQSLAAAVQLTAQLAGARQDQERAEGETRALLARIEVVERLSRQDGDRLREQVAAVQARSADLQAELAAAVSTAAAQAAQTDRLRDQLADLRAQASRTQAELAAERSGRDRDRQQLVQVQQELEAGARRRRRRAAKAKAAREGGTGGEQ